MRHPLIDADIKALFPNLNRPSQVIAALKAMLEKMKAENQQLKAALRLMDAGIAEQLEDAAARPEWTAGLTPQEIALVTALNTAYPRPLNQLQIMDCVHGRDHAYERDSRLAGVLVCRVRKKLGFEAIATVHGAGWKLGCSFRAAIGPEAPMPGRLVGARQAA